MSDDVHGSPRIVEVVPTLQTLRPRELAGRVVVVIDVFRATSTMVAAVANGADLRPCVSPEEARARLDRLAAARRTRQGLVLGGERLGLRIEGFDLGNSPLEYTREAVGGRTVFFCTTNGTRTLRRAAAGGGGRAAAGRGGGGPAGLPRRVLVAAFQNARAVARLVGSVGGGVVLACAGTRGGFSLEDILLAGLLVEELLAQARPGEPVVLRDLALAAAELYRSVSGGDPARLARVLARTDHARYLAALGFTADVAYCSRVDTTAIVPEYRRGRLVPVTSLPAV
ncbi:MAG: 2-phosphosulfolactate phosphatase [Firmicutes bacterium]|nr:2-phosphosulfolactate phosphatase [Bacillota bacterium]